MRKRKPELRLEVAGLGTVDPFRLRLVEEPASGGYSVEDPDRGDRTPLELAGLSLAGASQALIGLSMRWMDRAGKPMGRSDPPVLSGEIRMVLRRKEARLLSALLRRHLDRLPEPPAWMVELGESLEHIEEYLRWEDCPPAAPS